MPRASRWCSKRTAPAVTIVGHWSFHEHEWSERVARGVPGILTRFKIDSSAQTLPTVNNSAPFLTRFKMCRKMRHPSNDDGETPMAVTDRSARVALVGTLDTKGAEYQWMADRLAGHGVAVTVIDTGIREPHGFTGPIDIDQRRVAAAAGRDLEELRGRGDRGVATAAMGEGAAAVLAELLGAGELDGVLALGGSGGSAIAARGVRDLPIGLPKLIVSTMASGDVSPYVGASDVTLMYSVVDIAGINQISREVLGKPLRHPLVLGALRVERAHQRDARAAIGVCHRCLSIRLCWDAPSCSRF